MSKSVNQRIGKSANGQMSKSVNQRIGKSQISEMALAYLRPEVVGHTRPVRPGGV
jgi:hypothetical protein